MIGRLSKQTLDFHSAEHVEVMVIITHMLMILFNGDSIKVAEWLVTENNIFFGDKPIDRILMKQEASVINFLKENLRWE